MIQVRFPRLIKKAADSDCRIRTNPIFNIIAQFVTAGIP